MVSSIWVKCQSNYDVSQQENEDVDIISRVAETK